MVADQIVFDRDGWRVEIRKDDGLMQIRGRSPQQTEHLLLHIVRIDAGLLARPAIATNQDGRQIALLVALDG